MAFVFKHPKSKFWFAGFLDATGKRRNRSTKCRNRKEAQHIADQFETAARNKRTARQTRAVITSLHRELTGEDLISMTVRQWVEKWLDVKEHETAASTHAFYDSATEKFLNWLGDKADRDIADVTREEILAFRTTEAATLAPKTVES